MKKELVGQKFGRLTVISAAGKRDGRIMWNCSCECGTQFQVSGRHLHPKGTKSCGCQRSEIVAKLRASEATPFEDRLIETERGCLEWTGSRDRRGYGTLRSGKRDHRAHRVAYEKAYGPIPDGMYVCHICDNPPCCNPMHLFLGTPGQNAEDCVSKNRQTRGEKQAASKINEHLVRQIRKLLDEGKLSQQAIAELFGVHQTTVSKIRRQASWTHVT